MLFIQNIQTETSNFKQNNFTCTAYEVLQILLKFDYIFLFINVLNYFTSLIHYKFPKFRIKIKILIFL